MNCNHFQELIALHVEGDLQAKDIPSVEEHLKSCASCGEFAHQLRQSQLAVKTLQDDADNEVVYQKIRASVLSAIQEDAQPTRLISWMPAWRLSAFAMAALFAVLAAAGVLAVSRMLNTKSEPHQTKQQQREVSPETLPVTETQTAPQSQPEAQQIKPSQTHRGKPQLARITTTRNSVISGTVTDERGDKFPGVLVSLASDTGDVRKVHTEKTGFFRFDGLSSGKYSLTFSLQGFTEVENEGITLPHGIEKILRVQMRQATAEHVTVTGESLVVDTKSTDPMRAYVVEEYAENVPTTREPWVVLDETSGIDRTNVGGNQSGQQSDFAGKPVETPPQEIEPSVEPPAAEMSPPHPPLTVAQPAEQPPPGDVPKKSAELLVITDDARRQQQQQNLASGSSEVSQGILRGQNRDGEMVGEFPLKHTEVNADISGYLARTVVEQEYTNPYKEPIEAVYVFPLPTMAAVNDFVMEIGGRKIIGMIRPRAEAQRIYQEARAKGHTASLLTQERPNIFTQNVANIEPGGKVNIKITYFEKLVYDRGYYEYVFPMVVGPRYIPGTPQPTAQGKENGGGWSTATNQVPDADKITPPVLKPGERSGNDINLTVHLDAGLPLRDLTCATHKVVIENKGLSQRSINLARATAIPNRDFVLRWSVASDATQFGVLAHRGTQGGFFTLMMQPPLNPADNQVTPREITFILDVSGSMYGLPLDMSKEIVTQTLDKLRPDDIFNIFIFSGSNGQLWERPQANTPQNIAAAKQFLQSLQGSGGTEMLAGVKRALHAVHDSKYLQMYAFLTDGYVGNEEEILRMIKEERADARFFAFGIGSSVNRYLIEGIGTHGGGTSLVVIPRDRDHAERAVRKFFECIDSPVLVDISIDWSGLPVREVYPKKLPDLFAGQTINVIGRYEGAGKGLAIIKARLGAREIQFEVPVNLPEKQGANAALAPVWARNKIAEISGQMLTAEPEQQTKLVRQITDLAVRYRLVSQYTAFVAVDESRVVGNGKPLRVLQPVPMPEGVNYESNFGEKPVGQLMRIPGWGMTVQMTESGKIRVAGFDETSVALRSGIKQGSVLKSIDRTLVHDMAHLEGLLLQTSGDRVEAEFEPGGSVLLPRP